MERAKTLVVATGKSPWMETTIRWALALLFIIPSFEKMADPLGMARILEGYEVFPPWLVGVLAITVPFLQLSTGVCLLLGVWPWEAGVICLFLLSTFTVVITYNFLRGHNHDCGCFSFNGDGEPWPLWVAIIRNAFLICLNIHMLRFEGWRKFCLMP